jgi:hypothetical protein
VTVATPPSSRDASAGPLDDLRPDALLDGRYRLLGARAVRSHATLWRAVDDVLGRPVAVKTFPLGRDGADPALVLDAVTRASRAGDARLVRMYDARAEPGAAYGYVVTEWLDAPPLSALLRDGPLPGPEAVAVVHEVAQALAAAAAVDAFHGALHPDNVFVLPEGAVRVTDLEIAATLASAWGDDPADDDVRGLGALLYAATTAHWPRADTATALAAAPRVGDRPVPPRELVNNLAREIDGATMRLLLPPRAGAVGRVDDAARAAGVLAALPHRRPGAAAEPNARRSSRWPKLLLTRALPAAAIVTIGVVAWQAGSDLGGVPGQKNAAPALSLPASPGPSQRPAQHAPVRIVALRDYDPYGDGHENSAEAPLAADDDPSTAWYTSRYQGSPEFGGLKKGVGLLIDLGRPQTIRQVKVSLTAPGAALAVYSADSLDIQPATATPVGRLAGAGQEATIPVTGPPQRYWLLWITKLPPMDGGYGVGIAELAFLT